MATPRRHAIAASFLPALLALAAGCTPATPSSTTVSSEADVTRAVAPGLEQRVTLTPAEPRAGGDVRIRSVITNRGSRPVNLESRICGLTLEGNLRLEMPPDIGVCEGFSMGGAIAAGESRESSELRRVASPPGTYTLRVKHALQPELWVEMRVVVRGR
jgi:hypothetical protein